MKSEPAHMKGEDFTSDDFEYGVSVAHCSAHIRVGFLRKVYGLLAMQLLATTALACVLMFHAPSRQFATHSPSLLIVSFLASFGFLFACHSYKDSHPTNLAMLSGFTLSIAYGVGVTCAMFQANGMGYIVLQAFLLTAAVTCGLTAYTLQSKQDFSFMGAGLGAGLGVLIVGGLLNAVVGWITGGALFHGAFSFVLALAGAAIFSGYIVYDTWLISQRMGPDQYVQATLALYLDIVNLFLELLRVLEYLNNGGRE